MRNPLRNIKCTSELLIFVLGQKQQGFDARLKYLTQSSTNPKVAPPGQTDCRKPLLLLIFSLLQINILALLTERRQRPTRPVTEGIPGGSSSQPITPGTQVPTLHLNICVYIYSVYA